MKGGGTLREPQKIDLSRLSPLELLQLQASAVAELRSRKIVRTNNNPVADYAEHLAAKALALDLGVNSQAGHDAKNIHGLRYEVKARRVTSANPSRQLSSIRKLEANLFDWLIFIIFDESFGIDMAALLPHEAVKEYAKHKEHTNSHILIMKGPVLKDKRLVDITERIRTAQLAN